MLVPKVENKMKYNSPFKIWIRAARLRTLPLAASGILCGVTLAWFQGMWSLALSALALLTALLLQILSNFSNDYGDAQKGTDNEHRVGPQRTVQSGALSLSQMKRGMVVMAVASMVSGLLLIVLALRSFPQGAWLFFALLGLLSVAAAILYTVGKRAYGYHGLGDVMVFIFFGLVSVLGAYYLNAACISIEAVFVAIGIGLLSSGVLNLNNMRDIDNDLTSGKKTLAAKMGFKRAKIYHSVIVLGGIICFYPAIMGLHQKVWFFAIMLLPIAFLSADVDRILKTKNKATLDPYLKKLSIGTFFLSITFVVALVITHLVW